MSDINKDAGFGFLGIPYQRRLITQFITDHKFATNIMSIVDPNYFTDLYLRIIASEIKNAFEVDEVIPDMDSLRFRLNSRSDNDTTKLYIKAQIDEIEDSSLNDSEFVQSMAMKFCKQQELKKSVHDIQEIIDKGDLDSYDECEEILKRALEIGSDKDAGIDVFYDIEDVLREDFRKPIPTGIDGLDDKMNGGLSKGELGVILAPFGVGKTTMITKIANEAYNLGYNVLQVFFEDNPKVIQRKHLSCWTGIALNDLGVEVHRPLINDTIKEKEGAKGYLELKKFPSDGTTIPMIKNYVRKLTASGRSPDIILIDYIDCVTSTTHFDKGYEAEGPIMRQFESLLSEFDMAGWTAIQGNRSSINADTVDSTMIGGSIKKGQIGHFIVSIAKDLDQKEGGRANMAILKSRFGVDGIVFTDIVFDNARIQIVIEEGKALKASEMEEYKTGQNQDRINELMNKMNNKEEDLKQSEAEDK
jgi:replicative DNA helicase|tara:strand:+ start:2061 stop:3482 length:1422 start_codon:yes stop_codon:yes gene_type:complete